MRWRWITDSQPNRDGYYLITLQTAYYHRGVEMGYYYSRENMWMIDTRLCVRTNITEMVVAWHRLPDVYEGKDVLPDAYYGNKHEYFT